MASEYSVNIKLNTAQVKRDLKTIGDGIGNLGRKQAKGSKSALSDAEKALQVRNTQLGLENKILRVQNSLGPLSSKNVHQNKVMAQLADARLKTDQKEFTLAKQSIAMAEKEIQLKKVDLNVTKAITEAERKRILLRGRDTGFSAAQFGPQQPMQGPRFPTGAASALNFDRFTRKLLTGPAGSNRMNLRNLGRRFDTQSALISGGFPLLFWSRTARSTGWRSRRWHRWDVWTNGWICRRYCSYSSTPTSNQCCKWCYRVWKRITRCRRSFNHCHRKIPI